MLADECWPFHQFVIETLSPKMIICFGKTAGGYVMKKTNAKKRIDEFIEKNSRCWKSCIYENANGLKVVVATHPSRADWTTPATDPSPMIKKYI